MKSQRLFHVDILMSSFAELQHQYSSALRTPWHDARLVGNAAVAQEELLKLIRQSGKLEAGGVGGECISALLIGETGVGKSFVIRSAIDQLCKDGNLVIPVTLHGDICSDDKSSMRQIFSQLQRYLVGGSSLDSLTRATFHQGSLSEWCLRLARILQECTRSDHLVVIVLEEFDAFCHTKAKQSLLYNLFDLMHLNDTRFVVVGVTTRPDVTELLEKRIKSRFQLRKIVMSSPKGFPDLIEIVESVLCRSGSATLVDPVPAKKRRGSKSNSSQDPDNWVSRIRNVLNSRELKQHWSFFRDLGYTTKEFVNSALTALVQCDPVSPNIEDALVNCMKSLENHIAGDSGIASSILPSLTLRDHIVLISLLKLHQDNKRPKSFAHILKQIGSFEKSTQISTACRHSVRAYWHSFQGLVKLGLIEMIDINQTSVSPPLKFCKCRLAIARTYSTLFRDTASFDVTGLSNVPREVHQWANRHRDMQIES